MNKNPDPEKQVGGASPQKKRLKQGRLKIFLGYAAGVGKTFAMLDAARQRLGAGADVVAGYVETHGQGEAEEALRGIEVISRLHVSYRNVTLEEMDLDALLARRPDLALVDDLAHANAPGSRHARRYQDVLELLNAGIDVHTTLDVHHLESLNDVVAQITGVIVHETVPDHVLDEADEIELVDLPVDELLQRVEEGKIYLPDDVTGELYRAGNLTALRELALRRAADRIDEQMRTYMQRHGIAGPWPATERVLVCIGPSPLSERLVRTGRRLATRLNADWHAVYVETPDQATLTGEARDRVARVLRLADELGAKSMTVPSDSVAEAVTDYARTHNVTKIIAGKPLRPRWRELLRGSIVDQIIRDSHDVDVYVISGARDNVHVPAGASDPARRTAWTRFAQSAGLVTVATLLGLPLRFLIEPTNLVMFYLLAVIIAAIRLGRAPAIVASVLSVVAFDLVFVPPYYTFVVADAQYLLTFAALFGVGVVLSTLAARAREQARAAQRRAAHTAVLYDLSRDLAAAGKLEDVTRTVVSHTEKFLSSPAAVMVRRDGELVVSSASPGYELNAGERAAAEWAFQHSSAAGRSTETMAGAEAFYLPLRTHEDVVGVLGVSLPDPAPDLSAEQRRLLESFASQGALAIERSLLAEEAKRVELLREAEKLHSALLNSISHDLRTPLASISGALSSLRDDSHLLNENVRHELVCTAYDEAERLNRFVGNLLDMTRLESGTLSVSAEPEDVEDVIGVTLTQQGKRLGDRQVRLDVPEGLPLVPMDFVLMVQVFVNLLDNAHKYSPPGAPIEIKARANDTELLVHVRDWGPGIAREELDRIFDKFYRSRALNSPGGTGLGLSISKGVVEAHGGRIWARNLGGGGTRFTVALPLNRAAETSLESAS